jgi:hypothetical protein
MAEGRSKLVFKQWLGDRPQPWRDGIEVVAMYGVTGFKTAAAEELPDAAPVMDPFRVVRLAGDALDRCRQRVQQQIHGHRGRAIGTRHEELTAEILLIDTHLDDLLKRHAPDLLDIHGIGTEVASQLLITAGDNPERIGTEAALAALTGTAPLPASLGKTNRHRLKRGGDRAANSAVHRIVLARMRPHQASRSYVSRRTEQGLSKREIIRCLKRHVIRDIHRVLIRHVPPIRTALASGHQ